MKTTTWTPTHFFRQSPSPPAFALLILNQPINENAFDALYPHSKYTLCADGGANRFYDVMSKRGLASTQLPNTILGDLDSIRPEVQAHYEALGVSVLFDGDQYSTDFTKALRFLRQEQQRADGILASSLNSISSSTSGRGVGDGDGLVNGNDSHPHPNPPTTTAEDKPEDEDEEEMNILILGGLGGRVDQAFSQIHHLYSMRDSPSPSSSSSSSSGKRDSGKGNLYLISEESITFILRPGKNIIYTPGVTSSSSPPSCRSASATAFSQGPDHSHPHPHPQSVGEEEEEEAYLSENAGIIPLTGPARISTHGFEWDVDDWKTSIGGQLSTSNHIRDEVVIVQSEEEVMFTVELAGRFKVRGR